MTGGETERIEVVYLHPFTNEPQKETDVDNVRFVEDGVLLRLTTRTVMFIPNSRLCSIAMPTERAVETWGVGRDWKRAVKEAKKVQD